MPSLKSLSQEKLRFCSMNWITKGRFRQENLRLVWRLERRKIWHVNLLRIIHARMELETDHHHQPLELCMPSSVGGFWQETFLHVNSDWALLALQSLLCWEGRCQIAQSQIKSIESERMASFVSRSILLWIQCTKSRWSLSLFSYHPGGLKTMTAPKSHC